MLGRENNPINARLAGVRVASDGTDASSRGKPQTIVGVTEAKVVFVQYYDPRGALRTAMYFDVGGTYVSTPDTTDWCERLRPMSDWIARGVAAARSSRASAEELAKELSKEDSVDVIGG